MNQLITTTYQPLLYNNNNNNNKSTKEASCLQKKPVLQKNTPYQLVPLVNFLVTTCPVWNIEDHEEKFVKLSCHSTCNGWIDVLLLFDKIFLENFQEKWQWCIGDTFVSLKPCLPTYYSFLYCEKNILCLDQEEKNEKEKSNQVKTNINFCFFGHYYHERKYQLSLYPKPELLLPYLCPSFKKQKLSKLQRQKKIIPVKN